jgi:transposase, IS5 family
MKIKNSKGFFDESDRLTKLSSQSDPLVRLDKSVDWEMFRPFLEGMLRRAPKGKGGRPGFDYVLMFKVLILQRYYNLSDDQTEFQILDRLSFMRFLGLQLSDSVPDSKTVWHFRERLKDAGGVEKLFALFLGHLEARGLILHEGSIVDASFVEAPRQRNTREQNAVIKQGGIPQDWDQAKNRHMFSQKDTDARWTKKGGQVHYGYKNHLKADAKSKLVTRYVATDASEHDSQALGSLLTADDGGKTVNADSAYGGPNQMEKFDAVNAVPVVNEKGAANKPLTEAQKAANRLKSSVRCRVEHIFGFIETNMGGSFTRFIGLARNEVLIGLMNLTYNMFRMAQLLNVNARKTAKAA